MLTDDKNKTVNPEQNSADNKDSKKELPVQNPFNDNNNKEITQEDLQSEQDFKEAQTERD